jgi:hypothetical protein
LFKTTTENTIFQLNNHQEKFKKKIEFPDEEGLNQSPSLERGKSNFKTKVTVKASL